MSIPLKFDTYSYEELLDVERSIDRKAYPDRYQEIVDLLSTVEGDAACSEIYERLKYQTFLPRLLASFIDSFPYIIIVFLSCLALGVDFTFEDDLIHSISGCVFTVYTIYMHGTYGQTLGKMVAGVKVYNFIDESEISLLQALKRESVSLVLGISLFVFLYEVTQSFLSNTVSNSLYLISSAFGVIVLLWWVSEFVTMFFNKKRRALHDYIGSTVVIRI